MKFSFANIFFLPSKIISFFAGHLKKHAEQGGPGHRLWHHCLRHRGRQHHGHGLFQDGQAAADNLQLLSLQVHLLLHIFSSASSSTLHPRQSLHWVGWS